ncbi:MAG: hypothetical protein ABJE47_07615 [bacterium]
MTEEEPIRLELTPDQRESIRRASGQHVEALDLVRDDDHDGVKPVHARWRVSIATGIPRQAWVDDEK